MQNSFGAGVNALQAQGAYCPRTREYLAGRAREEKNPTGRNTVREIAFIARVDGQSSRWPERTLSRSFCCPSYLVGPSDAKVAVIAFTASRSKKSSGPAGCEGDPGPGTGLARFWFTDVGKTKSLFRRRQPSVC